MTELAAVYKALHDIMAPYAAQLDAKRDDAAQLYVDTRHTQKALLEQVSAGLRARIQGKSCFNFTAIDQSLFAELAALTRQGYASYERQGFAGSPRTPGPRSTPR